MYLPERLDEFVSAGTAMVAVDEDGEKCVRYK
jgi:hypothetical protein